MQLLNLRAIALSALMMVCATAMADEKIENKKKNLVASNECETALSAKYPTVALSESYVGEERGQSKALAAMYHSSHEIIYVPKESRWQYQAHFVDGLIYEVISKDRHLQLYNKDMNPEQQKFFFVMDHYGRFYLAGLFVGDYNRFHESSLLSGQPVAASGVMVIRAGQLIEMWYGPAQAKGPYLITHEMFKNALSELASRGVDVSRVIVQFAI